MAFTFLSVFLCTSTVYKSEGFKVEYKGALKNIMHKGDLSAKVNLQDLETLEHLYALGAVENLKGEILILDGKPFISSVQDQELATSNSFTYKATLIVYTSIEKWKSFEIPDSISTYKDLEDYVYKMAKDNKIDVEEPFPFLLSGVARSIDWHVIDWKLGDNEHTHEKHINSGMHGTLENQNVEILGFYSNSHHTIFTHHSTNMHLHVKTSDEKIAGHLDGFTLGPQMILQLPEINKQGTKKSE